VDDLWERFKRRGEAIERSNLDHLRSLTLDQAVRDMESLLRDNRFFPPPDVDGISLPVSIARLISRKSDGSR